MSIKIEDWEKEKTKDEKLKELVCEYDYLTPKLRKSKNCFNECATAQRCQYLIAQIKKYCELEGAKIADNTIKEGR